MNYSQAEQISEWVSNIYAERFTAWEDIQEDVAFNETIMTAEMLGKIKEAIETYIVNPAQAAISEIEEQIQNQGVQCEDEDESSGESAEDNLWTDRTLQDYGRGEE